MAVLDRIAEFIDLNLEDLHILAKQGLWVSVAIGVFGLLIDIGVSLIVVVSGVGSNTHSEVIGYVASKGVAFLGTAIVVVPLIFLLRVATKKATDPSPYVRAPSDLLLSVCYALLGHQLIVRTLNTIPASGSGLSPTNPFHLFLGMGILFVVSSIGTAGASLWLLSLTTLAQGGKNIRTIARVWLSRLGHLLTSLAYYPRMVSDFAEARETTWFGAVEILIRHGCEAVRDELRVELTNGDGDTSEDSES